MKHSETARHRLLRFTLVLLVALVLSGDCLGAGFIFTNRYITHDNTIFWAPDRGIIAIGSTAQESLRRVEALPAAEDPFGNWGFPVEGFQLSVRLPKAEYRVGEPIGIMILLRNVSERPLYVRSLGRDERLFEIHIGNQANRLVALRPKKFPELYWDLGSGQTVDIWQHTQRKYEIRLDQTHELDTPGEYQVYVASHVPKLDGPGLNEVRSGTAIFRVVDRSQGEGKNNKGPFEQAVADSDKLTTAKAGRMVSAHPTAPSHETGKNKSSAQAVRPGQRLFSAPSAANPSDQSKTSRPPTVSPPKTSTQHFGFLQLAASAVGVLALAILTFILHRARTRQKHARQ